MHVTILLFGQAFSQGCKKLFIRGQSSPDTITIHRICFDIIYRMRKFIDDEYF